METTILFALIACCMIGVFAGAVMGAVIMHDLQEVIDDEEAGGAAGGETSDESDRGGW